MSVNKAIKKEKKEIIKSNSRKNAVIHVKYALIMGRTFANTAQISRGFEMYAKGYRRSRILGSFGDQSPPSLRTLGNWITRYKNVSEDILTLEHDFEWPHMDMYSIPWEHAHLINRLSSLEHQKPSVRRVSCLLYTSPSPRDRG